MAETILFRTLMDEHLTNMELVITNTLYRFKAIATKLDNDFLDDFEEKTVDRVNQVCEQFKSSLLRNLPSSSSNVNVIATRSEVSSPQRTTMKRLFENKSIVTRSKRVKPNEAEFLTDVTEDDSSSSSDSSAESQNKGNKYICIVGIHDSLIQDERKLKETFQKLCQCLGIIVLDRDIEKIYTNKQVKPHSLIVMLKQSDVRKQITNRSKKIDISPNLNVVTGNRSANKITIGRYNIPGWSQKTYTTSSTKGRNLRSKPRWR